MSATYLITTFSFFVKIIGSVNGFKTKSWHLAGAILLANSFFIAIALLIIGLILDIQPKLKLIFLIFLSNFIIIFIGHLFIRFNTKLFFKILNQVFNLYFKQKVDLKYQGFKSTIIFIDKPSLIAWLSLLIGFLFPSILAVIFNEYRSTLFQFSFIFNSIGTLITVIYTDRRASIYTDKIQMSLIEKNDSYIYFLKVINSRLFSTFFVIVSLIITYLCLNFFF